MSYPGIVYSLLFDGMVDHSVALALRELRASPLYRVVTAGFGGHAVAAASGFRILPDIDYRDIDAGRAALFILPDGGYWQDGESLAVTDMLHSLRLHNVPVAAIGNAVLALAHAGLLASRRYTADHWAAVQTRTPFRRAPAGFEDCPALCDAGLITARGNAAVEFAYTVLDELRVYAEADLPRWLATIRHGRSGGPAPRRRVA